MSKPAATDHPVHELISSRWSPYAFQERPVPPADLLALFEAARWAPSSFNEQPWRWVLATRDQTDAHELLLSCLVEPNRQWAGQAPVLVLCLTKLEFTHNGKPNGSARHDVGLASATLTLEATARGLAVHQMSGILPERIREVLQLPEGFAPVTAMAIGYPGEAAQLPEPLREREQAPRSRKALAELLFGPEWERPSDLLSG